MGNIYDLLMRGEGGCAAQLLSETPSESDEEALNSNALGRKSPGNIVCLAGKEFIVLGREEAGVALIAKDIVEYMEFGRNADYLNSAVRQYCNETFYRMLADAIGADNILAHTIDLIADDGTGGGFCDDFVSILTTERYRKYRKYLPAMGNWWWTATRVNADNDDYARRVCDVRSRGVLDWHHSGDDGGGVRPFCILNPALLLD